MKTPQPDEKLANQSVVESEIGHQQEKLKSGKTEKLVFNFLTMNSFTGLSGKTENISQKGREGRFIQKFCG